MTRVEIGGWGRIALSLALSGLVGAAALPAQEGPLSLGLLTQ